MARYFSICFLLALASNLHQVSAMFEGDVLLTPEQQATLEATSNPNDPFAPQNAVVSMERQKWRDGMVPYILDNSLNSQAITAINMAIATYTRETCIRFVRRTNEADYVRFFSGGGCFSYIGRIGGPQDISIGSGCESEGIVLHEMFHALGRWHEQSREDRDNFVRILTENIQSGRENNFEITNPAVAATTQGVSYDFRSIMHYRSTAFSRNGQPTILPIGSSVPASDLGQRRALTASDIRHAQTLYCGGDAASSSWSSWSSWSSCSRSCNGGISSRMRQCVGGSSCEGSNIQRRQCNTQSCPVSASWSSWGSWSSCSASCGGGRQNRIRSCVGGNTCVGVRSQFRDCVNSPACPQPASWGSWGSWSSCSSTCQGGNRQRRRTCQNGNSCPGANFQNEECNTNIPCTSTNSGQWSSWTSCSAQCGGGIRRRVKFCSDGSCSTATEEESCNTQECRPEPTLRGIHHRGCWYLNTRRRTLGLLEGSTPELSDNPFIRTNPVSKCAVAAQLKRFNIIGVASGYCVSGSNVLSDYQYVQSSQCRDGKGGYTRGYFLLDVYEITDRISFSDSVADAAVAGTEEPVTGDVDQIDSTDKASPGTTSSIFLITIGMMLFGYFAL